MSATAHTKAPFEHHCCLPLSVKKLRDHGRWVGDAEQLGQGVDKEPSFHELVASHPEHLELQGHKQPYKGEPPNWYPKQKEIECAHCVGLNKPLQTMRSRYFGCSFDQDDLGRLRVTPKSVWTIDFVDNDCKYFVVLVRQGRLYTPWGKDGPSDDLAFRPTDNPEKNKEAYNPSPAPMAIFSIHQQPFTPSRQVRIVNETVRGDSRLTCIGQHGSYSLERLSEEHNLLFVKSKDDRKTLQENLGLPGQTILDSYSSDPFPDGNYAYCAACDIIAPGTSTCGKHFRVFSWSLTLGSGKKCYILSLKPSKVSLPRVILNKPDQHGIIRFLKQDGGLTEDIALRLLDFKETTASSSKTSPIIADSPTFFSESPSARHAHGMDTFSTSQVPLPDQGGNPPMNAACASSLLTSTDHITPVNKGMETAETLQSSFLGHDTNPRKRQHSNEIPDRRIMRNPGRKTTNASCEWHSVNGTSPDNPETVQSPSSSSELSEVSASRMTDWSPEFRSEQMDGEFQHSLDTLLENRHARQRHSPETAEQEADRHEASVSVGDSNGRLIVVSPILGSEVFDQQCREPHESSRRSSPEPHQDLEVPISQHVPPSAPAAKTSPVIPTAEENQIPHSPEQRPPEQNDTNSNPDNPEFNAMTEEDMDAEIEELLQSCAREKKAVEEMELRRQQRRRRQKYQRLLELREELARQRENLRNETPD